MSSQRDRQKLAQLWLRHKGAYHGEIDGRWGNLSETAYDSLTPIPTSSTISPPSPDFHSVTKVFGRAGDESNLVRFTFPYTMRLAWGNKNEIKTHRCHKLIKAPLEAALAEIFHTYGIDWIVDHGLDLYGGCFNFRKTRGGNSTSKHSWGIAIDLNPAGNGNSTPWADGEQDNMAYASMPTEAIEIFEKHGFKSGARAWGRDAMHFQFTK